jgi:alpha-L-fucosidase
MYVEGTKEYEHHRRTWGEQRNFGYKDFIPMFKAEQWDPQAWASLFKQAGARYVVPVAEHHDGFPMYACSFTPWNAARMGPCRDVVAELGKVVRQEGLKFGVSTHRAFNWRYYTFRDAFDTVDSANSKLYGTPHPDEAPLSYEFVLDWYARTRELVERFQPEVLYFDFGWHRDECRPWRKRITADYYNHAAAHGYEPVLQYKDKVPEGAAVLDIERAKSDSIREQPWQTDTSVSYRSWGYIEDDELRTVPSLVHDLVDIVSKNGNLLLNIGPRADGTIPDDVVALLRGLGAWLQVNGESIYGTRPWERYGEGPTGIPASFREKEQQPYGAEDIRFTARGDVLYATVLGPPGTACRIKSLGSGSSITEERISSIHMLGHDVPLQWAQDEAGLTIHTPPEQSQEPAYVFKMVLKPS